MKKQVIKEKYVKSTSKLWQHKVLFNIQPKMAETFMFILRSSSIR